MYKNDNDYVLLRVILLISLPSYSFNPAGWNHPRYSILELYVFASFFPNFAGSMGSNCFVILNTNKIKWYSRQLKIDNGPNEWIINKTKAADKQMNRPNRQHVHGTMN